MFCRQPLSSELLQRVGDWARQGADSTERGQSYARAGDLRVTTGSDGKERRKDKWNGEMRIGCHEGVMYLKEAKKRSKGAELAQ